MSREPCKPLSFPVTSSTGSLSAQQAPVRSLPALPHPWEVQLFSHTIKHTVMTAFKPLPHLPFFQGFLILQIMDGNPFCVPGTIPACTSLHDQLLITVSIQYHSAPAGAHCFSGLHSLHRTSLTLAVILCFLQSALDLFSDHNSCLQLGLTNLGDSWASDSLVSSSIFIFF